MIPYLPFELLQAILAHLSTPRDLARACSTSKTFLSIAQPLLYDNLRFTATENIFVGRHPKLSRLYVDPASYALLRTLESNPQLQQLVRHVKISGRFIPVVDHETDYRFDLCPRRLIKRLVEILPIVKLFTLDNIYHFTEVDEAARDLQRQAGAVDGRNKLSTMYSMRVNAAESMDTYLCPRPTLGAAYTKFRWTATSDDEAKIRPDKLLRASQNTLCTLCIPVPLRYDSASLVMFHRLERLALDLSFLSPSEFIPSLVPTITDLPSLRALVLHGKAREEDITTLLNSGTFALALPFSLTHLSLDFDLTHNDVLSFLRDLPTTSNLKRFNCSSETGEMDEVIEAFGKRGIMMSLNEDWDIWW